MKTKKILKIAISVALAALLFLLLTACSSKAPELSQVKEDFVSLIEQSKEINEILFGDGLPVYERGGEEDTLHKIYDGLGASYSNYEIVSSESKYLTIGEIKEAAERVYSKEYLESIYETTFVGYADATAGVFAAKYYESEDWLFQNMDTPSFLKGVREYDFSTMKIIKPSKADFVNVEIDSTLDGQSLTIQLSFVKQGGEWRLDSPTY